MRRSDRGFSLIELMVVVVIVAILASIAIPSYSQHVKRAAVEEATAALSSGRVAIEQYYLDNREYDGVSCPASTSHFTISCSTTANTYIITATGLGSVDGFVYTLNQLNQHATTSSPWGTGACWIDHPGSGC